MKRIAALAYGIVAYGIFLATFLYAVGFIGGFGVPRSIDAGPAATVGEAITIDLALLVIFALQHSVMARQWFKRRWTRLVPQQIERSTYVLASSLVLILLFWAWRPISAVVLHVEAPAARLALYASFALGWGIVLVSTFLLDHFELFGLKQVWLYFRGKTAPPTVFRTPGLYRLVRHPLMLGFIIAISSTPTMTAGHLLFAAVLTAYILVAIQVEERDLVASFGDTYRSYQHDVPMLVPRPPRRSPN